MKEKFFSRKFILTGVSVVLFAIVALFNKFTGTEFGVGLVGLIAAYAGGNVGDKFAQKEKSSVELELDKTVDKEVDKFFEEKDAGQAGQ